MGYQAVAPDKIMDEAVEGAMMNTTRSLAKSELVTGSDAHELQ